MKIFTKASLIKDIKNIASKGWIESVKATKNTRNDGAVGNTLESLLGIKENNLPLPNAREWELKGQRANTSSLITLKHIEPSPTGLSIVSNILLPQYGWKHKEAGKKYSEGEMSFRSTTNAKEFTKRGFRIVVDRNEKKVKFIFDPSQVNTNQPEIKLWLESVRTFKSRTVLGI
jgi:hypothetical protein